MRKALAMGAHRGILVTDPALAGSDTLVDGPRPRGGAQGPRVRPPARRRRHVRRRRRRRAGRRRGAAPAAVPLLRGEDRARPGGRTGPRPPDQPDRLRRPRGADAGARRLHPGARRAALPVAQGDHGGALEGGRDEGARPTSASTRRRSAARSRRRRSSGRRRRRRAPRRASSASAPDEAARELVAFLAERRII